MLSLYLLSHQHQLMQEGNHVSCPCVQWLGRWRLCFSGLNLGQFGAFESSEQVSQESIVVTKVGDDVDLVEEQQGVENIEGGIVQHPGKDHVLEVMQAVCLVDLCQDYRVFDLDDLLEAICFGKEFAVRSFVLRIFRVICWRALLSLR